MPDDSAVSGSHSSAAWVRRPGHASLATPASRSTAQSASQPTRVVKNVPLDRRRTEPVIPMTQPVVTPHRLLQKQKRRAAHSLSSPRPTKRYKGAGDTPQTPVRMDNDDSSSEDDTPDLTDSLEVYFTIIRRNRIARELSLSQRTSQTVSTYGEKYRQHMRESTLGTPTRAGGLTTSASMPMLAGSASRDGNLLRRVLHPALINARRVQALKEKEQVERVRAGGRQKAIRTLVRRGKENAPVKSRERQRNQERRAGKQRHVAENARDSSGVSSDSEDATESATDGDDESDTELESEDDNHQGEMDGLGFLASLAESRSDPSLALAGPPPRFKDAPGSRGIPLSGTRSTVSERRPLFPLAGPSTLRDTYETPEPDYLLDMDGQYASPSHSTEQPYAASFSPSMTDDASDDPLDCLDSEHSGALDMALSDEDSGVDVTPKASKRNRFRQESNFEQGFIAVDNDVEDDVEVDEEIVDTSDGSSTPAVVTVTSANRDSTDTEVIIDDLARTLIVSPTRRRVHKQHNTNMPVVSDSSPSNDSLELVDMATLPLSASPPIVQDMSNSTSKPTPRIASRNAVNSISAQVTVDVVGSPSAPSAKIDASRFSDHSEEERSVVGQGARSQSSPPDHDALQHNEAIWTAERFIIVPTHQVLRPKAANPYFKSLKPITVTRAQIDAAVAAGKADASLRPRKSIVPAFFNNHINPEWTRELQRRHTSGAPKAKVKNASKLPYLKRNIRLVTRGLAADNFGLASRQVEESHTSLTTPKSTALAQMQNVCASLLRRRIAEEGSQAQHVLISSRTVYTRDYRVVHMIIKRSEFRGSDTDFSLLGKGLRSGRISIRPKDRAPGSADTPIWHPFTIDPRSIVISNTRCVYPIQTPLPVSLQVTRDDGAVGAVVFQVDRLRNADGTSWPPASQARTWSGRSIEPGSIASELERRSWRSIETLRPNPSSADSPLAVINLLCHQSIAEDHLEPIRPLRSGIAESDARPAGGLVASPSSSTAQRVKMGYVLVDDLDKIDDPQRSWSAEIRLAGVRAKNPIGRWSEIPYGWHCAFCPLGDLGGEEALYIHYAVFHADDCFVDILSRVVVQRTSGDEIRISMRLRIGRARGSTYGTDVDEDSDPGDVNVELDQLVTDDPNQETNGDPPMATTRHSPVVVDASTRSQLPLDELGHTQLVPGSRRSTRPRSSKNSAKTGYAGSGFDDILDADQAVSDDSFGVDAQTIRAPSPRSVRTVRRERKAPPMPAPISLDEVQSDDDEHSPDAPWVSHLESDNRLTMYGDPALADDDIVTVNRHGVMQPQMLHRRNDFTNWSSRVVPGTALDLLPDLDAIYDGGRQRWEMTHVEENQITVAYHIPESVLFVMVVWNRWRYEKGPISQRFPNLRPYLIGWLDKYWAILNKGKVEKETKDHLLRLFTAKVISGQDATAAVAYWDTLAKRDRQARGELTEQDRWEEEQERLRLDEGTGDRKSRAKRNGG